MFLDAYAGKTVLITGHTGFKGAWLSIYLGLLGAKVVGYALEPPTVPSLFDMTGLGARITHIHGDVRDYNRLHRILFETHPDFIFHLAAQPLVLDSYSIPYETFEINVMGSIAIMEAIRVVRHPVNVIMVTTDKCYENREWIYGYRETDPMGGKDPYSASKGATELAIASYRRSFFPPERDAEHSVRIASVRAGNVIGGGDWATNRIVPDAIRALSKGESLEVRCPSALRPWQHVLEPLSGYLWLAANMAQPGGEQFADAWNFGPLLGQEYTVAELADAIVEAWGSGSWIPRPDVTVPHEATWLKLSIDKASTKLRWLPVWDFAMSIQQTVGWYKQSSGLSGEALYQLCLENILKYTDSAIEKKAVWTF